MSKARPAADVKAEEAALAPPTPRRTPKQAANPQRLVRIQNPPRNAAAPRRRASAVVISGGDFHVVDRMRKRAEVRYTFSDLEHTYGLGPAASGIARMIRPGELTSGDVARDLQ